MAEIDCRYFTGYKPCGLSKVCEPQCPQKKLASHSILIIHLEALGAVLRATSVLPAIRRKYPTAQVTWITQRPADQLLHNNPLIDRVLTTDMNDILQLNKQYFDIVYCIDKSLKATGVLGFIKYGQVYGFKSTSNGKIIPATAHANELWELGLNDHKKFFENKKPETQLMVEALNLGPFKRDKYNFTMTKDELRVVEQRRNEWKSGGKIIVGLNTGCAATIPYKKFSVDNHLQLLSMIHKDQRFRFVLLGGKEDGHDHQLIAKGFEVIQSPTHLGLRDGISSVAACDIVVTGDSLGMHMAIAQHKWVVAWFGPTCAQEIDLYDRGVKVLTQAPCSPCWKRSCHRSSMCYDLVDMTEIVSGIEKGVKWQTSISKQPLLETFSSPSQALSI